MHTNKILTTLNQRLVTTSLYTLTTFADGTIVQQDTLDGVPLGTSNNASDGEIGAKVILISDRSAGGTDPSVATPTQVASNAASVLLLASNPSRKGASIFNTANKPLHLSYVNPAVVANTVADIATGGYFEVPFGYTGPIYGIWDSSPTGNANINEF